MRKIVFHLNCLEQGGAERVVTTLANYFVKHEYQVYIATQWYGENEFAIAKQIERVHVGLIGKQKKASRPLQFFYRIINLKKYLKKVKPDIVIAFAQKANYRALMATAFTKIPVIVSVRTDPYKDYMGIKNKLLIALLFSRASGNVFQTIGAKEFFSKKIQEKSRIILNPIHEAYLNMPSAVVRRKAVVQSGRLVRSKNQLMLLEAFETVHEAHPEYVLELYGDDSGDGTKELLEQFIADQQASGYIKLMGACNNLEERIADASIFAFSSDFEGLPNALMEAMALGLPVISTDCPCGGPATLIQNEVNGLLIPVGDKKAMAEGIKRLIEDNELAEKMGEKARAISKLADTQTVCEQWKSYIEEICK